MMSRTTLKQQLLANLGDHSNSDKEYRWNRGLLYNELRLDFPPRRKGDLLFVKFLNEEIYPVLGRASATKTQKAEKSIRSRLMIAASSFERDQYMALEVSVSYELTVQEVITKYPEQWQSLVGHAIGAGLKKSDIRKHIAEIKAGTYGVQGEQPETPITTSAEPEEGSYFSNDPFTRELQRELIRGHMGKACEFLGLTVQELQESGATALTAAYRRASMKYHPDRNTPYSSEFAFDCVECAYALISSTLGLQNTMAEINEMMGN